MRPSWEGRTLEPTRSYGAGVFALPLPASWASVLEAAGQPGTLREILARAGTNEPAEALRAIFLGLESGLLAFASR